MFEPYLMGQYQYPWQGMPPTPNWQPQTPQFDHYQKLYNQMTRIMTNYRSEHGDLSPELQEFYDWQRTKTMDYMAEVKVLVDSYK